MAEMVPKLARGFPLEHCGDFIIRLGENSQGQPAIVGVVRFQPGVAHIQGGESLQLGQGIDIAAIAGIANPFDVGLAIPADKILLRP